MAGIDAFGIKFERSDMAVPPVFTAIANVTDISPPELTRRIYETTAHDSPDQWSEHTGGIRDGGDVGLELNYDPPVHDVFIQDLDAEPRDYRIVWPPAAGGGTWSFKAILKKVGTAAPVDDKLTGEHTYQVTGKPTIA